METSEDVTCSAARTNPHQPRSSKRKSLDSSLTNDEADLSPRRKRISPLLNTPKQRKDECKRLLRMSQRKLEDLGDPEVCLRKSVLVNNTIRRLRQETEAKPRLWRSSHHTPAWMQDDDAWYWGCDTQDSCGPHAKRSRNSVDSEPLCAASQMLSSIFDDEEEQTKMKVDPEESELSRLDDVTSSDDVVTCARKRRRCSETRECECLDSMNNNCSGDRTSSDCRECESCHRGSGTDPPEKEEVTSLSGDDFSDLSCSCSHQEGGSRDVVMSSCRRRQCGSSRKMDMEISCASAAHNVTSQTESFVTSHGDPGSSPPSCGGISLYPDQSSASPFCCPSWDSLCNDDPDSELPYLPSLSDSDRQFVDIDLVFNNLISVLTGS